jgi:hypothetical protein
MGIPGCHCPEGPAPVGQECPVLKSWCLFYLPQRAEHVKDEEWDKANRSNSQARQTNEYHNELTTPATAFEYEMPRHGCALELAANPLRDPNT